MLSTLRSVAAIIRSRGISAARFSQSTRHYSVDKKKYSKTLNLPVTTFPLRNRNQRDVDVQYRQKTTINLYQQQRERTGEEFILHDGPPYANGNLHMGHALNRILKDVINRYKLLRGHRIHYVPGWDCHGLPIEQKALQEAKTSHLAIDPIRVRQIARKTALAAIETQKNEMKEIGIMADWDSENGTYRTLSLDFEVRQMRLFANLVDKGLITHRLRPVYYSPSSRTALAEAELKYANIKSRSVYVAFPVSTMSKALKAAAGDREVDIAIWTTTPWTLPANMAVAISEDIEYALVAARDRTLIVAVDRMEALEKVLGPIEILATLEGSDLVGSRYSHRFNQNLPIIASRHVTSDSGTGLVHSAPAHGHEDYDAFLASGSIAELLCPVDDAGLFTHVRGGESLLGKSVLGDGVDEVISLLGDTLLAEETIDHRYPHDWKTKEPIIVRATPQWFADVTAIKPIVQQSLDNVQFHPAQSRKRLESFVDGRAEWCISRQRSWGVPIPALHLDGKPVLDADVIHHLISILEEKGTDYWWQAPVEEFVPPHLSGAYTKGTDTLDVWFDSGSSWTLLNGAADVYLEGSDQHRGWFQSSILTYVGASLKPVAPFRHLITHGFILDEEGQKMSKSSGNGISPLDVINAHGADVLRFWAASVDYTRDVSMGSSAITHAAESVRKVRSALRFMLANAADGEHKLSLIDRHVLAELSRVEEAAMQHYDAFAFSKVLNVVSTFLSSLSSVYFDAIKDVLYMESSPRRAGAAYTLHQAFITLVPVLAPILPHLAEELWQHAGYESSVFLSARNPAPVVEPVDIQPLLQARSQLLSALAAHGMRVSAVDITVQGNHSYKDHDIVQILGVAAIRESLEGPKVENSGAFDTMTFAPARGSMCARCWRHTVEVVGNELCVRCEDAVGSCSK